VLHAPAINIIPDDLAQAVDAVGMGALPRRAPSQRIVDGGVRAAAVKEAMIGDTVAGKDDAVISDDLTRIVDVRRLGAGGGRGIVG